MYITLIIVTFGSLLAATCIGYCNTLLTKRVGQLSFRAFKWDCIESNMHNEGAKWVSNVKKLEIVESCYYTLEWYLVIVLDVTYKDGKKSQYNIPYYNHFNIAYEDQKTLEAVLRLMEVIKTCK